MTRRQIIQAPVAFASAALLSAEGTQKLPRLGVVTGVGGKTTPEEGIGRVQRFGLPTCQVSLGPDPDKSLAPRLKEALAKYNVQATAMMTLGPGKMIWDFANGPATIGLVPKATRAARIAALKRASDIAKACDVGAVHTHCGFIPENPSDPQFTEVVAAIKEVASYCKENGQTFLMETGQETPITMLRTIEDVGTGNVGVNLDTANLILYGKGEPVGALDVLGKYVHGLHAKDGLYPTDPKELGKETPIGQGKVRWPEVMNGLRRLNYSGPITIERETRGPQQEADIQASVAFLSKLIKSNYGQS